LLHQIASECGNTLGDLDEDTPMGK
jgi:hypothetical protein